MLAIGRDGKRAVAVTPHHGSDITLAPRHAMVGGVVEMQHVVDGIAGGAGGIRSALQSAGINVERPYRAIARNINRGPTIAAVKGFVMIHEIAAEALAVIGGNIRVEVPHRVGSGGQVVSTAIVVAEGVDVE